MEDVYVCTTVEFVYSRIKNNKTEDSIHKCNEIHFCDEKKDNIINITVLESTENLYHVTRQNLHFAHAPYNENKNKKWELWSELTITFFYSEMIFFRLDWEEISCYGQKYFREMNNRLCKVSTVSTTRKRNDCLCKILFPETYIWRLMP